MDYVLKPSLEHIALTKIAVALWDQDDVMTAMTWGALNLQSPNHKERRKVWLEAEDRVIEKVLRLLLPEHLKKKVLKFISGIGWEIFMWREHHYDKFSLDINLPRELCWTPHGTVDTKKTAEALIQNENIDIMRRYRLACVYCLEDYIPKLWDKAPENFREQFDSKLDEEFLVAYWTYGITGEVDKHKLVLDDEVKRRYGSKRSHHLHAFVDAANCGNKAAIEYFLQRLTHGEREEWLVRSPCKVAFTSGCYSSSYYPSVLCFLFSQMDKWQQIEAFKKLPYSQLSCLLQWPLQNLFLEMANHMCDFLPEWDFCYTLREIIERVEEGYRDWDYGKLFAEFWHQRPNAHKQYVIKECKMREPFLLSALFEIQDIENVRLILNSATVEDRRDILFTPGGKEICEHLVDAGEWDSLKLFFQECLPSKEVTIELKEDLHIICKMPGLPAESGCKYYDWDAFFQLRGGLIQDNNNKSSAGEAGESTSAMKLPCSESEDITHGLKIIYVED